MENGIKTSVMATVLETGNPNFKPCLIVEYIGGYSDNKDWNVWWDEINNSFDIEDIFIQSGDFPQTNRGCMFGKGQQNQCTMMPLILLAVGGLPQKRILNNSNR